MARYFVCRFYEEEFRARFCNENIDIFTFSLFCHEEKNIASTISAEDRIFHGPCMKLKQLYTCDITKSCLSWSIGSAHIEQYISEHCYLVTGGWLKYWREVIIGSYGFSAILAKKFFSESYSRIIYFDNQMYKDYLDELNLFSEYIGLKYEIIQVGQGEI